MRRLMYLLYYLRETDFKKLGKFVNYASSVSGRSKTGLVAEAIKDTFKYKTSILDYFYFRFFEKTPSQKAEFAGTGFMYEYQLRMNPQSSRSVLADKIAFMESYSPFIHRKYVTLSLVRSSPAKLQTVFNGSGKIVLKNSKGQVGAEVEVLPQNHFKDPDAIRDYMERKAYDLAEEYVEQHPALMKLSNSGLNTVRVITQLLNGNKVIIIGARLRITINSSVDNMAAGNAASPIDVDTGIVSGPGVFSDITREPIYAHPVTGVQIQGFVVPFWNDVITMARDAARFHPENRSIGWDIAISQDGPQMIEGNHNWCKLLWQLPVNMGLKSSLKDFN